MDADRQALVFSEGRIEVSASPEALWDIMADFEDCSVRPHNRGPSSDQSSSIVGVR